MKYPKGYKVMDDQGREYSKKPLPKKRAEAQMRALYAAEGKKDIYYGKGFTAVKMKGGNRIYFHGEGFFGDIFAKIKSAGKRVVTSALQTVSKAIGTQVRKDYPPKARHNLAKYSSGIVEELLIRRAPVQNIVNTALNFITAGKWDDIKSKYNYDKLFHLSMIITLKMPNGSQPRLIVEKNEVINISDSFKTTGKEEYFVVPVSCCVKFWDFMDKAQKAKGVEFFKYDAFRNNCQIFLDGILSANGINTPDAHQFIMQDVDKLLQELPEYVSPFANLTTNIAGLADRVLYGQGMECCGSCSEPMKGDCALKGGCGMCGAGKKSKHDTEMDIVFPASELKKLQKLMAPKMKGKGKEHCMPQSDYMAEHSRLIGLLNDISKKAKGEADTQAAEVQGGAKDKPKRAPSVWIQALREWNKGGIWCIPRKGTKDMEEVRAIMDKIRAGQKAPKGAPIEAPAGPDIRDFMKGKVKPAKLDIPRFKKKTEYKTGDIVKHNGKIWSAIHKNSDTPPWPSWKELTEDEARKQMSA
jgi:hypothetical protein